MACAECTEIFPNLSLLLVNKSVLLWLLLAWTGSPSPALSPAAPATSGEQIKIPGAKSGAERAPGTVQPGHIPVPGDDCSLLYLERIFKHL